MSGAVYIIAAVVLIFGLVIVRGAPYLPTTRAQIDAAFELLDLKRGQRLLELGAGDGAVALEALRRGFRVTAIELNPLLCLVIWLRTRRYRHRIKIKCGDFWTTNWGDYDAIYTFLLQKYMTKLDKKIIQQNKSVKLASFAFTIPGRIPTHKKDGVYLYIFE